MSYSNDDLLADMVALAGGKPTRKADSLTEKKVPCMVGSDHLDTIHWVEGIGWCDGHCPNLSDSGTQNASRRAGNGRDANA
jgi:hypothetical protein